METNNKKKQFKYETIFDKKIILAPAKSSMKRDETLSGKNKDLSDNELINTTIIEEKCEDLSELKESIINNINEFKKELEKSKETELPKETTELPKELPKETTELPKENTELFKETTTELPKENTSELPKETNTELPKEIKDQTEIELNKKKDFENSLTLEDIHINLRLLSKIEIGNKLILNGKYISIDTSFPQFITRWFYGASRNDSLQYINIILSKAIELNKEFSKSSEADAAHNLFRLTSELKNSLNGLTNLKQTYYLDKLIQSEIDVMIENVLAKIDYKQIVN